jgi:hypothetical protein
MKRFNPWPWVAPAVLLVVVIANVVLIQLARHVDDPLVLEPGDAAGVAVTPE